MLRAVPCDAQAGANPDGANKSGVTPLRLAAYFGYAPVTEALLRYNADATLANKRGQTALDVARSRENTKCVRLLTEASKAKVKAQWTKVKEAVAAIAVSAPRRPLARSQTLKHVLETGADMELADIFVSLEDDHPASAAAAEALRTALTARGAAVFVGTCKIEASQRVKIEEAIGNCRLAVVIGTANYGVKAGDGFSTFDEFELILSARIPIFLVRMCDSFAGNSLLSEMDLPSGIEWRLGSLDGDVSAPEECVDRVMSKLLTFS